MIATHSSCQIWGPASELRRSLTYPPFRCLVVTRRSCHHGPAVKKSWNHAICLVLALQDFIAKAWREVQRPYTLVISWHPEHNPSRSPMASSASKTGWSMVLMQTSTANMLLNWWINQRLEIVFPRGFLFEVTKFQVPEDWILVTL